MSVDLQTNIVTIVPRDDRVLDLAAVPQAIRSSGFQAGTMRLRAHGNVTDDGRAFRIDGWPAPLPMSERVASEPRVRTIEASVEPGAAGVRLHQVRPVGAR